MTHWQCTKRCPCLLPPPPTTAKLRYVCANRSATRRGKADAAATAEVVRRSRCSDNGSTAEARGDDPAVGNDHQGLEPREAGNRETNTDYQGVSLANAEASRRYHQAHILAVL